MIEPMFAGKPGELKSAVDALITASASGTVNTEADAAREAVNGAWAAGQKGLSILLEQRIGRINVTLARELALSIFSLALAAFLSLTIARGLNRRMSGLLGVIEELRKDNASVQVPYLEDTNETGRLAGALDMVRRGIIDRETTRQQAEAEKRAQELRQRQHDEELLTNERSTIVNSIGEGLAALARGDLTYRIQSNLPEAYSRLREDFNTALATLQQSVRSVVTSVAVVRSGADEVGQAADSLSRRTEQQAAALEETAAALDEITATVRKSADSAARANQIVTTARSDAESSGAIVQDAVSAMGEIEKSSTQISQIISVIDEIAFQTNLLALNAGVEAARAGEAGRGFAVVASEVRALAQRSSDAAKEIKQLISASADHVGSGVRLVDRTGAALQELIGRVSEINELVGEIAASAREQATALQEVNTAVNQMDQVTLQNAAMVEESTAASHSLAQEASELTRLLSTFSVGEEGVKPARRTAPATAPKAKPPVLEQQRRVATFAAARTATASAPARPASDDWEEF